MTAQGNIYGINGPIIYLKGDCRIQREMVYVGTGRLVGEIIGLTSERTTIEVYEETTRLKARRAGHWYRGSRVRHPGSGDPDQYF